MHLDCYIGDGLVEAVESRGRLDHAQLEVVHFLLAKVDVGESLVERRGEVLGASQSGDRPVHLKEHIQDSVIICYFDKFLNKYRLQ